MEVVDYGKCEQVRHSFVVFLCLQVNLEGAALTLTHATLSPSLSRKPVLSSDGKLSPRKYRLVGTAQVKAAAGVAPCRGLTIEEL